MINALITLVFLALVGGVVGDGNNQSHCEIAASEGKLGGVSIGECVCIYNQTDAHLTPEIKDVLKRSQLAGVSPTDGLIALGPVPDFADKMQNFGKAITQICGIRQ